LGPLGQEYIGDFLSGNGKNKIINTVYGICLDKDKIMMLGIKKFDVDSDHIIIDVVLAHRVFTNLFSKEFRIHDYDVYTESTKAYYWL